MDKLPFTIAGDFEPVDQKTWQQAIRSAQPDSDAASLGMQTDRPPSDRVTRTPVQPIALVQEYRHGSPLAVARAMASDIAGGTDGVLVGLAGDPQRGLETDDPNQFDRLFDEIALDRVTVELDAGAEFSQAADRLIALWDRRGVASTDRRGGFGANPWFGQLGSKRPRHLDRDPFDQVVRLATRAAADHPQVATVTIDASSMRWAIGGGPRELALAIAAGTDCLRMLVDHGLEPRQAASQIRFRFDVGTEVFVEISRLRAARQLWSRVLEVVGAADEPIQLHARTSDHAFQSSDRPANLLRNTSAMFAAILGGADAITSRSMDHGVENPSDLARRIARNTGLVMTMESRLDHVIDPAGGSYLVENWTDQIAVSAWAQFQSIEQAGGMTAAINDGLIDQWIGQGIDQTRQEKAVAT